MVLVIVLFIILIIAIGLVLARSRLRTQLLRRGTTEDEDEDEDEPVIQPKCLEGILTEETPDPKSDCLFKPKNGICLLKDTVLKDGCCVLDLPPEMQTSDMYLMMGVQMGAVMATGAAADAIIVAPINFLEAITKRAATREASESVLGKFITRLAQKIASKQATKALLKMSSKMAKAANIATAVAAVLDIADPYGYSTFVSNKYLADMRDTTEYYIQVSSEESGSPYPLMFDINWMYGDVYDSARVKYVSTFMPDATKEIFGCLGREVTDELMNERFVDILTLAIEMADKDPVKRDKFIYDKITYDNPDEAKHIGLYLERSTEDNTGISINQEGVKLWHTLTDDKIREHIKRATFFVSDMYTDESATTIIDYINNFVIAFTKTYRYHQADDGCREPHKEIVDHIMSFGVEFMSKIDDKYGNECIPRMRPYELEEPIPMLLPNVIYNFCKVGGPKLVPGVPECENANPEDFNVGFNENTNLCVYSRDYCDRMALDYNSQTQDCDWYPGQEGMELFFPTGTTVTRNVMRYGTSIKNCDDPEYAADYDNVHDCRAQNIFGINRSIDKANAIGDCGKNWKESGYRTKESCEFARTGSFVSTVVPFSGVVMGDCGEAMFKEFVTEAYDAGEGFKDLFVHGKTDYFEDKTEAQIDKMENRANAVKDIFTGDADETTFMTAFTGNENPGAMENMALGAAKNTGAYKSGENVVDFVSGGADYEDPMTYVNLASIPFNPIGFTPAVPPPSDW